MKLNRLLLLAFAAVFPLAVFSGETKEPPKPAVPGKDPPKPKEPKVSKIANTDMGPFMSYTLEKIIEPAVSGAKAQAAPRIHPFGTVDGLVTKGITVKLGHESFVTFDTEVMRYAVGWTGGFLDFSDSNAGQGKGNNPPFATGKIRFGNKATAGVGINGEFKDTREHVKNQNDRGVGPLPYDYAQYKGLYVNGDRVIFSYTVHGVDVLDMPGASNAKEPAWFSRVIQVAPSKVALLFALGEKTADEVSAVSDADGVKLETHGTTLCIAVAPHEKEVVFTAAIGHGNPNSTAIPSTQGQIAEIMAQPIGDLHALCKGGPEHWAKTVETQGKLGTDPGPYAVDIITTPDVNPYNSWIRPGGFDFFADGTRAAVCMLSGDVWIVSGIDDTLNKLTWKRFATGLYEPLGLKIVDEKIYVLGRDQITRLHDLNGDGEADFYESFCAKWNISPSYHAFSFDLWTDKDRNFYFANDLNQVEIGLPGHGVIFKISKDGSKIEEIAHGLRAPNGMAIGPNGEVVSGDNEGFWMPASKINWIKPGNFLGFPGDPRKVSKSDPGQQYKIPTEADYDQPMCWVPHKLDTSSGGQAFVTSDRWGPFKDGLIHTSYGSCSLFYAMREEVDGKMQGGTVKFPLTFPSGIMRARFNDKDGQLYLCGLRGWQTNGSKDSGFCRVRYTGKTVAMPYTIKTHPTGIDITFTTPLDEASAKDVENYGIEVWGYRYAEKYGSKDYKVSNPQVEGHDTVTVEYVNLSADKKTVSLALKDMKPVMQMGIKLRLKAADGTAIRNEIDYTIHKVGK